MSVTWSQPWARALRSTARRGTVLAVSAAAAMVCAGIAAPAASAAPQADQSSSGNSTRQWSLNNSQWEGQSFTPSVSDVLSQISVKVFFDVGPGPITMKVYDTTGGLPTGAALASQAVTGIPTSTPNLCDSLTPTTVTFDNPATLVSGHMYAFTLEVTAGGVAAEVCANQQTYLRGVGITASPPPTWVSFQGTAYQLLFTTYMGAVDRATAATPDVFTVVHQALPMPSSGSCADVADADVAYGTGIHGGWQKGWEPWAVTANVGVHGGWACIRALVKQGSQDWRVNNAYA